MEQWAKSFVAWIDSFSPGWLGHWGTEIALAIFILLVAVVVFLVAMTVAGLNSWVERRVSGRTQSRVGPNRVGPLGLLQWLADGAKMILKEDVIPAAADKPLFRLAPYPVMIGVYAAFACIPFGQMLIAADLNVGALYLLAITSLVVVGVLMAGWASNNKWSLLGGIRSAAQIVSYEIPVALSLVVVVIITGTLSMQGIVLAQGGWPWEWIIFHNPFTLVLFFLYFTGAVAEGNRTPFDLPEAESELVAGYNTEYSGIRFGGFFLGEYANILLMAAITTTLFFGGWQVPGLAPQDQANSVWWQMLGLLFFVVKSVVWIFVVCWLRWTLPRMRVDQLMSLCYRYLIPLSFVCLLGTSLIVLWLPEGSLALRLLTTALGAAIFGLFFWRVAFHFKRVPGRFTWSVLPLGEKGRFDPEWQVRRYGKFRRRKYREAQ